MKKIILVGIILALFGLFTISQVITPPSDLIDGSSIEIGTKLTQDELNAIDLTKWDFNAQFIEEDFNKETGDFYAIHSYEAIEPSLDSKYDVVKTKDKFEITPQEWVDCVYATADTNKDYDYEIERLRCKNVMLDRWAKEKTEFEGVKITEMQAMQTVVAP